MPNVPVIIYTDHGGQIVERDARTAAAAATVFKSENVAVLVHTIRELLNTTAA